MNIKRTDTLATLRAISGAVDGDAYRSSGRAALYDGGGGVWLWDSSDLSAEVTADPQMGLYAAPTSDATGATGSWVRDTKGALSVLWFGATGDGSTDDATAIQAALDSPGSDADPSGSIVFMPPGVYRCASTLRIRRELILEGSGHGRENPATELLFDDETSGIIIDNVSTSGSTARGDWAVLRNFAVFAAGKTSASAHGITFYARATLDTMTVSGFGGNGVQILGGLAAGPSGEDTNASLWEIHRVRSQRNEGHGLYIEGGDSNAGSTFLFDAVSNGGWGILDSSFLGNLHTGCHSSSNGIYAQVFHLGNRYYLAHDNAASGSTTEPGTDATVWVSLGAGVVHIVYPQWVSGNDYKEGGAYKTDGDGQTMFVRAYAEGSQPPNVSAAQTSWIGGTHGADWFSPTRAELGAISNQITVRGDSLRVQPGNTDQFILHQTTDGGDTTSLMRSLSGQDVKIRLQRGGSSDTFTITDSGTSLTITPSGGDAIQLFSSRFRVAGELEVDGDLNHDGSNVGFYGTAPVAKQTGVAVDAASIHAALVALGLIGV